MVMGAFCAMWATIHARTGETPPTVTERAAIAIAAATNKSGACFHAPPYRKTDCLPFDSFCPPRHNQFNVGLFQQFSIVVTTENFRRNKHCVSG